MRWITRRVSPFSERRRDVRRGGRRFRIKLNPSRPRDISHGVNIISDLCLSFASAASAAAAGASAQAVPGPCRSDSIYLFSPWLTWFLTCKIHNCSPDNTMGTISRRFEPDNLCRRRRLRYLLFPVHHFRHRRSDAIVYFLYLPIYLPTNNRSNRG